MILESKKKSPAIQLLALDIDGTLVTTEKKMTDRTRRALHALQKKGIHLALNSGRPLSGLVYVADQVPFTEEDYYISNTGAMVSRYGQERQALLKRTLGLGDYYFIREHLDLKDVQVGLGTAFAVYMEERDLNRQVRMETAITRVEILPLSAFPQDGEALRLTFWGETEAVTAAYEASLAFSDRYTVVRNEDFVSEVLPLGCSKGAALLDLARMLGLDPQATMAIGDGRNDVEMLSAAGLGVAMGNGVREAKEAADLVIGSNDQEGLAIFLEEYFQLDC